MLIVGVILGSLALYQGNGISKSVNTRLYGGNLVKTTSSTGLPVRRRLSSINRRVATSASKDISDQSVSSLTGNNFKLQSTIESLNDLLPEIPDPLKFVPTPRNPFLTDFYNEEEEKMVLRIVRRAALLSDKMRSNGNGEILEELKNYEDMMKESNYIVTPEIFQFSLNMINLCTGHLKDVVGVSKYNYKRFFFDLAYEMRIVGDKYNGLVKFNSQDIKLEIPFVGPLWW